MQRRSHIRTWSKYAALFFGSILTQNELRQSGQWFCVQVNINLKIFLELVDNMFSRLKRRGTIQFKSLKACISDADGTGNLHILTGTINAERFIQVLEATYASIQIRLFQGRSACFSKIIHLLFTSSLKRPSHISIKPVMSLIPTFEAWYLFDRGPLSHWLEMVELVMLWLVEEYLLT